MVEKSNSNDVFYIAESTLDIYETSGVPELLKELEVTRDLQILYKSWDELFSQGSVFSYSFLAFPDLVRIAEQWHYSDRPDALSLSIFNYCSC